jgi:hypothetical protein
MRGKKMTITIDADPGPFVKAIRTLPKPSQKIVDGLIGALESGAQVVRFDLDRTGAATAGKLRVVFQPSDFMLGFMTALRACDRNRDVIETA